MPLKVKMRCPQQRVDSFDIQQPQLLRTPNLRFDTIQVVQHVVHKPSSKQEGSAYAPDLARPRLQLCDRTPDTGVSIRGCEIFGRSGRRDEPFFEEERLA